MNLSLYIHKGKMKLSTDTLTSDKTKLEWSTLALKKLLISVPVLDHTCSLLAY